MRSCRRSSAAGRIYWTARGHPRTLTFVRSIKEECLSRMIFLGRASLRHAIAQYMSHYHGERNHQGLENRLLQPVANIGKTHDPVKRRQRLGGMLSYYHRQTA